MHEHVLSCKAVGGAGNFYQKGQIFLENERTVFFCFHSETKTHTSQCGRVVKASGVDPALNITALLKVRFPAVFDLPTIFFFNFELK